ncbi:MAG: hypothetical protein JWM65_1262, partial [Sphingomonas bacterium]|nr:hypothetical protein [Sphingomonas bacterium]
GVGIARVTLDEAIVRVARLPSAPRLGHEAAGRLTETPPS